MSAWPHGDPRDVVRSIVADPRFVGPPTATAPAPSWFDDLRAWLAPFLRRFFHALDHALGSRNPLDSAIGFVIIAAAFALLGYCVYLLVRSYGRARSRTRRPSGRNASSAFVEQTATALRAAALAAARAGRFRDAAALLFASAVRALDERGRVSFDPARTPGEYRRIVRDPVFDALASDAVVALFAAAEPRDELFERMNRSYEQFFEVSAP